MKLNYFLFVLFILTSCTSKQVPVNLQNPFVGGVTGLSVDFQNIRDVYDGGSDPFDINVKVSNLGESYVPKNKVQLRLSGFNPAEFGLSEQQLVKISGDDLLPIKKDAQSVVTQSGPVFVDFTGLNHASSIVGALQPIIVAADICYGYTTAGVGKLCVRSNILNPQPNGICEMNGNKDLFSSGAPVQLANLVESTGGKDKISFSFDVKQAGLGYIFQKDSVCDRTQHSNENKVYVKINTQIPGLTCTGLSSSGSVAEGFVTLFNDGGILHRIVTCTQQVSTSTDFEQVISFQTDYDYEDSKQVSINVKSSGGSSINAS